MRRRGYLPKTQSPKGGRGKDVFEGLEPLFLRRTEVFPFPATPKRKDLMAPSRGNKIEKKFPGFEELNQT